MKLRSLLVIVIALLLVMMPVATNAQDIDPCFGLAAEDCAELNAAGANLAAFAMMHQSYTFAYDLQFSAEGLPEEQAGASSVAFNSNGAIDVAMSGNGSLPITVGAAASADFGMGDMMENAAIEARIVDDYLYVNLDGSWKGSSLAEAMSDPDFMSNLEEMSPVGSVDDIAAQLPDAATLMAFTTVLDLPGLISHVREGNDFIFTLDLTAIGQLAQPENADKLNAIMEAAETAQPGAGEQVASVIQIIPMMLSEGTITVVQSVNPDLNIIDNVSLTVDAIANAAMVTGSADPITVTLSFNLGITNIDSAPTAVAPAEFEEVELEALMGGM